MTLSMNDLRKQDRRMQKALKQFAQIAETTPQLRQRFEDLKECYSPVRRAVQNGKVPSGESVGAMMRSAGALAIEGQTTWTEDGYSVSRDIDKIGEAAMGFLRIVSFGGAGPFG